MKTRAEVVIRRTYARPTNKEETEFETWEQIAERVKGHQRWLWSRANEGDLNESQEAELEEFKQLMIENTP